MLSVWYINNPVAGDDIASRCDCVILGINNPFVVEVISNIELEFGLSVPNPTLPLNIVFLMFASPKTTLFEPRPITPYPITISFVS